MSDAVGLGTFIQKPEGLSRDCVAPPMDNMTNVFGPFKQIVAAIL